MFLKNCTYTPSLYENMTIGGFDLIAPFMLENIDKAFSKEEEGSDRTDTWDLTNDIMYVNLHLFIAHLYTVEQFRMGVATKDIYKATLEKYKIDCIRKNLACKGFDIDPLLHFYGIIPGMFDGIDFMNIEDGDNTWIVG